MTTTLEPRSEPVTPAPVARQPAAMRRLPVVPIVAALVGAVVFALYLRAALVTPVHFDGAMNLQVATNLARGMGWQRFYHGVREFPPEVQTSGPFVLLDAAAIKVFGQNQFAFQFANLSFLAVLMGAVALCVRQIRWAMVVVPALVLLGIPDSSVLSLGALGEFAVAGLTVAAIVLGARAISDSPHPYRDLAIACALVGVAVSIKTIAIAALPIVIGAAVLTLVARRDVTWWKVGATLGGAALPLGLFELYRLASLGSIEAYRAYWSYQRSRISIQSGVEQRQDDGGLLSKGLDHLDALTASFTVSRVLVAVYLVLPIAIVAVLVLANLRNLGAWLRKPLHAAAVLLAAHSLFYEIWWMFITPTQKAWLRRFVIGLVTINLLYAVLLCLLISAVWAGRQWDRTRVIRAAAAAGLAVVAGLVTLPVAWDETDRMITRTDERLDAIDEASDAVADLARDHRIFGDHWYSAPVVSLTADIGFYDLSKVGLCELDPSRDVLVFDQDARSALREPHDRTDRLIFREIADYPGAATLYTIEPAPGVCPS